LGFGDQGEAAAADRDPITLALAQSHHAWGDHRPRAEMPIWRVNLSSGLVIRARRSVRD